VELMINENLPERADYQRAIYEALRRIERLLSANEQQESPRAASLPPLTIDEAADAVRINRSKMRELIYHGTVRVVRIGRRVLVTRESLDRLLSDQA
jgi:excisionase family DNA binding protein